MGNVWIGGNGGPDSHVLKFTAEGEYLSTYGEPGQPIDSNAMDHFGRVADVEFDFAANEAYFADGYGNRRVAVVDIDTGEIKRTWGAYGNVPDDDYQYEGVRQGGDRMVLGYVPVTAVPHPGPLRGAIERRSRLRM